MIKYHSGRGENVRLVFVCSGKGGTGKSCVSAYTAVAMALSKKKTLIIDAGQAPGSLDIIFGLQNSAVFNLWDVLGGMCELQKAILPISNNLFLLPGGISPVPFGSGTGFTSFIRSVKYDYDFVFVDVGDTSLFEPKTIGTILLVTTPDTLSVRAAALKSRELYAAGAGNIRLVINNVPARVLPMKSYKDFDDIIDQIGAQLIALVPASQRLQYSANNGAPLSEDSLTVQVFHRLAARLRGRPEPLLIR